ncbi:MAG: hypothetical protein ACQEQC_00950 [Elusimicrobiota bacterium]
MRFFLALTVILTSLVPSGLAADDVSLDLEDLYVWGEDRADVIGLYESEKLPAPYLNKDQFIPRYTVPYPEKLDAKYDFLNRRKALLLGGGYGINGEYYFNAAGNNFNFGNWAYNYQITARNNSFIKGKYDNSSRRGSFSATRDWETTKLTAGFDGMTSRSNFDKNLFKLYSNAQTEWRTVSLSPRLSYTGFKIDGVPADEFNASVDSDYPLKYNQWLYLKGDIFRIAVDKNTKWGTDVKTGYINTLFKDFSFRLWAGFNNFFNSEITGGGRISGSISSTSYSFYLKREVSRSNIYTLHNKYPQLLLNGIREFETNNALGFSLSRKIYDNVSANLETEYKTVDNYLTFYRTGDGYFPVNLDKNQKILRNKLSLKLPHTNMGYIYRDSPDKLPYLYNSFFAEVENKVYFDNLLGRVFVKYTGEHDRWLNSGGTDSEPVSSFVDVNLELIYNLNKNMRIRGGAQNIFSESVVPPVSFEESKARMYIILTYKM